MKMAAINFSEWIYIKKYVKYFGNDGPNCGKWYEGYTPPNRKYYTTDELYELFMFDERVRIQKSEEWSGASEMNSTPVNIDSNEIIKQLEAYSLKILGKKIKESIMSRPYTIIRMKEWASSMRPYSESHDHKIRFETDCGEIIISYDIIKQLADNGCAIEYNKPFPGAVREYKIVE